MIRADEVRYALHLAPQHDWSRAGDFAHDQTTELSSGGKAYCGSAVEAG